MAQTILKAENRPISGKSALKNVRRTGKLPAVVYGKQYENKQIAVDASEVNKLLKVYGGSSIINLVVDGEEIPVIMKEIQRDTLNDVIQHIDFMKVSMTDEITLNVPIYLIGDAQGIKVGGILQNQKRELSIKSLPQDIPETVELDVSNLNIGDSLTVADINLGDKVTILDDPDEVIVSIIAPKVAEEIEEPEAEEEEEQAEPEVVAKGKEKEEE
ncbi:MAG: 50S ribosomal protein L25/general stress protein Ctc [Thermoanaerobacterales bacterium]|jgi:large subunit ribosomal protein L25|nr:50S ribosomal protein L25/general stress protein Ctc [Thermoanaerobacterales bacterium]